MLLHRPTPQTWNRWSANIAFGTLMQALILLIFSLFLFPDLGQAGLEDEYFLGTILGRNYGTFLRSSGTIAGALVGVAALIAMNLGHFRFGLRLAFGIIFCALLNIGLLVFRPEIAQTWFVFQRSSSFRAFQSWLLAETAAFSNVQLQWLAQLPILLLATIAFLNLVLGFLLFRKQNLRLQKHKKHTLGRSLDTLDKRLSIAGVSLLASIITFSILVKWIDSPFRFFEAESSSLRSPNVFLIGIDGLGETKNAPFLDSFFAESELQAEFINGSTDPYAIWGEWMSCKISIRTGRRNYFGRGKNVSTAERNVDLVFQAQREGYTTLLSTDLSGIYLENEAHQFQRKVTPHLTVSALAENSLLRSVPSLQAFVLATDLKQSFSSVLLSKGANSLDDVGRRLIGLIDDEIKPGKPIFATTLFSLNEELTQKDFPFLGSQSLKHQKSMTALVTRDPKKSVKLDTFDHISNLEILDSTLQNLWNALETRNLLKDSVFLIVGMRPPKEQKDSLKIPQKSSPLVTSLHIKTNGLGRQYTLDDTGGRLYRSIDLAPTLAKRMRLKNFPAETCDGESFLDPVDKIPNFPRDQMYGEFSLAETMAALNSQGNKIELLSLLESRTGDLQEFTYAPGVEEFLSQARTRIWFQGSDSLVYAQTHFGLERSTDQNSAVTTSMESTFQEFLKQLGIVLQKTNNEHFYIQENSLP